jgi:fused signal recognition particle receptor
VNGSGKTTTIGKLAAKLQAQGKSVLLAAGDTFRAAAAEQLEVWASRVGAPVVRGKENSDPSSVIFEGIQRAKTENIDVVIADTAGRLHTKVNLMDELQKVRRVIGKAQEGAPHETWLVIDATSGQNAIAQAQMFTQAMQVTGIVLTKLDGTAKGGVILGIADQLRIPVRFIGIGERVDDLRQFDAEEFVEALLDERAAAPDAAS